MAISRRNFTLPDYTDPEAIAWLKERLLEVEDEIASGKTMTGWNADTQSAEHGLDKSLDARTRRKMILNDLGILDPVTFPPANNNPIKQTVPRYL